MWGPVEVHARHDTGPGPSRSGPRRQRLTNRSGTSDGVKTYVYSVSAALQSGKTVASVTLPNPANGFIGVFDIGGA